MILLETKALSIQTNKIICQDLNFRLRPGDIVGILGANGSGKTTLLKTLAGLIRPHQGCIHVLGTPQTQWTRKAIAQQIGLLLQNSSPQFAQTVFEFCHMSRFPHGNPMTMDKHITEQALITMELIQQKNQSIDTLSGGEYKRLCIAALLTQTPVIYLLDEVTNHLDLHYQMRVFHHFKQLADQGAGIIVTTHDIPLASHYCKHILMLFNDGTTLYGETNDLINEQNLTRLYQHPFHLYSYKDYSTWLPDRSPSAI